MTKLKDDLKTTADKLTSSNDKKSGTSTGAAFFTKAKKLLHSRKIAQAINFIQEGYRKDATLASSCDLTGCNSQAAMSKMERMYTGAEPAPELAGLADRDPKLIESQSPNIDAFNSPADLLQRIRELARDHRFDDALGLLLAGSNKFPKAQYFRELQGVAQDEQAQTQIAVLMVILKAEHTGSKQEFVVEIEPEVPINPSAEHLLQCDAVFSRKSLYESNDKQNPDYNFKMTKPRSVLTNNPVDLSKVKSRVFDFDPSITRSSSKLHARVHRTVSPSKTSKVHADKLDLTVQGEAMELKSSLKVSNKRSVRVREANSKSKSQKSASFN